MSPKVLVVILLGFLISSGIGILSTINVRQFLTLIPSSDTNPTLTPTSTPPPSTTNTSPTPSTKDYPPPSTPTPHPTATPTPTESNDSTSQSCYHITVNGETIEDCTNASSTHIKVKNQNGNSTVNIDQH